MSLVHFLRVSLCFTLNQESDEDSFFFFFFWQINLAGYVQTEPQWLLASEIITMGMQPTFISCLKLFISVNNDVFIF